MIKRWTDDAQYGGQKRAMGEWAGVDFSGIISDSMQFAPRFLWGDVKALLVILEDIDNG